MVTMAGDQYGVTFAVVRDWVDVTSARVELERVACRVRDSALCVLLHIPLRNTAAHRFSFPVDRLHRY